MKPRLLCLLLSLALVFTGCGGGAGEVETPVQAPGVSNSAAPLKEGAAEQTEDTAEPEEDADPEESLPEEPPAAQTPPPLEAAPSREAHADSGETTAQPDGAQAGDPSAAASQDGVTLSVAGGGEMLLGPLSAALEEGDTVFLLLRRACREQGVALDYAGSAGTAYVRGIGNLYEFDEGPESGWMYAVNGAYPSAGCGTYTLEAGDVVEWRYTTNLGADLGAAFG